MLSDADLAHTASLIGDATRARILVTLLDGRAHPAGDLARDAAVSPATASQHLARLLDGNLVTVSSVGRHRFYSLANDRVAAALETLATISPARPPRTLRQANAGERLRHARSCYDHVAGRVGVVIADALVDDGVITPLAAGEIGGLLEPAHPVLSALGVPSPSPPPGARRPVVRGCLDWTEQRPHLAGGLGAAILGSLLDRGWLARRPNDRALNITPQGVTDLARALDVDGDLLAPP